jgi:hypothetical protein
MTIPKDLTLGVSPITLDIFAGRTKPFKDDPKDRVWVGEKINVTDAAIRSVFEWMMLNAEREGAEGYAITFPSHGTMSLKLFDKSKKKITSEVQS